MYICTLIWYISTFNPIRNQCIEIRVVITSKYFVQTLHRLLHDEVVDLLVGSGHVNRCTVHPNAGKSLQVALTSAKPTLCQYVTACH